MLNHVNQIDFLKTPVENENYHERNFDLDFSGENIKHIWQDETKLKELFPQYSYRPAQEELSLRTGQSFKNNQVRSGLF